MFCSRFTYQFIRNTNFEQVRQSSFLWRFEDNTCQYLKDDKSLGKPKPVVLLEIYLPTPVRSIVTNDTRWPDRRQPCFKRSRGSRNGTARLNFHSKATFGRNENVGSWEVNFEFVGGKRLIPTLHGGCIDRPDAIVCSIPFLFLIRLPVKCFTQYRDNAVIYRELVFSTSTIVLSN